MPNDGPKPLKKTWEELTAAASTETDAEKLAVIMEEIFAALEERERSLFLSQNPPGTAPSPNSNACSASVLKSPCPSPKAHDVTLTGHSRPS